MASGKDEILLNEISKNFKAGIAKIEPGIFVSLFVFKFKWWMNYKIFGKKNGEITYFLIYKLFRYFLNQIIAHINFDEVVAVPPVLSRDRHVREIR